MGIWKSVIGYEGIYEVSDSGQIKRIGPWSDGRANRIRGLRRLNITHNGYLRIRLHKGKARQDFPVHRIVFLAFHGAIPEGYQINHKNGIKTDNTPKNLEAMTPSQNQQHSYTVLGRKSLPRGVLHPKGNAKLKASDIPLIRAARANKETAVSIARRLSVCRATIDLVLHGKTWIGF